MQASGAGADQGWPSEMTVFVTWDDELLALAYTAHAWQLDGARPLDPPRPSFDVPRPAGRDLETRWQSHWDITIAAIAAMRRAAETATARAEFVPPTRPRPWFELIGADARVRSQFREWRARLPEIGREPYAEAPEQLVGAPLVRAWRLGLRTIVLTPYAAVAAERATDDTMLVTHATRADVDAYAAALDACWEYAA